MDIWSAMLLRYLAKAHLFALDQRGQTLAEYSLIITDIAVGIVALALLAFRDALSGAFNGAVGCLDGTCSSRGSKSEIRGSSRWSGTHSVPLR